MDLVSYTQGLGALLKESASWLQPLLDQAMASHIQHISSLLCLDGLAEGKLKKVHSQFSNTHSADRDCLPHELFLP